MWCCGGKNGLGHFCFIVLFLPPKPSGRGEATPGAKDAGCCVQMDRGTTHVPTRCLPVLVLNLNDRLGRPHTEESSDFGDSATRIRALLRRHPIAVPINLATPTFYGSSGRSRIVFLATPPSVQFSRIFVKISAGRRLQLIPSAGPRDHMPLTLDLVTDGLRHCPGSHWRKMGPPRKLKKCSRIPLRGSRSSQELETNIRNSTVVGRAATDATPDDAWENLVRIIQETAGSHFYQGAPRSTRPPALERRRFLKDLGTARRLTGV